MPDAGIIESPQKSADIDDDDEADQHAPKELELGVNTARPDVVFSTKVVPLQGGGLENVDEPYCEPAQGCDEGHDEALADEGFDRRGQAGNGR